ncbi:MAG TPA: ABC transporter permease [Gemmatimonadaceae bacterium]|nr:ABC transporter permease [Gemmatimonadaceae bacterium]
MSDESSTRAGGIREGVRRLFRAPLHTTDRVAADANDELRTFLDERIDHLVARGMSPAEARAEALRRMGAPLGDAREMIRDSAVARERTIRTRQWLEELEQDVRYAVRTLGRDRAFTISALAIIALGIGASATVFSVANALLVRPLPFRDPDALVWVANGTHEGLSDQTAQVNHIQALHEVKTSFADVAGYFAFYGPGDASLVRNGDAIRLTDIPVTQNFFSMLGVQPVLGRSFTPEESSGDVTNVVILSYSLWQREFASDPSIVGTSITLNGSPQTIVGVLPSNFDFGSVFAPGTRVDLFSPFPLTERNDQQGNTLALIGRLRPGATIDGATAELAVLAPRITAAHPDRNAFSPHLSSMRAHVVRQIHSALVMLAFAVGAVMLIVCANLSNLLLVRATARRKEMAIRAALGAGRRRLVRQMLTESVLLSAGGAAVGLVLALVGTRAISRLQSVNLPMLSDVRIDSAALAFIIALATLAGLLFGMAPALQLSELAVHDALKASGRGSTENRGGRRMRTALVVSEIALACALLVGSGLLVRSFLKLLDVDLGFRPEMVTALRIDPDNDVLASQARFASYVDEALRLTKAIPGVQAAAITDGLPLGKNRTWGVKADGETRKDMNNPVAYIRLSSDGLVGAMGMQLVAGRDLAATDDSAHERVVMINETMAHTLWPGQDPIGKVAMIDTARRVVGVVRDVHHLSLDQAAGLELYIPYRQIMDYPIVELVVRSTVPSTTLAKSIRAALAPIAPNVALNQVQTLGDVVDRSVSPRRFFTLLLSGFAAFALALALFGIYGVVSYTVAHQQQEIGVRMALGASQRTVQRKILRDTLELAIVGIVVGTAASWIVARLIRSQLFGVSSTDPATFVAMIVIVTAVALVSGYLPARRASRIDPTVAFRSS